MDTINVLEDLQKRVIHYRSMAMREEHEYSQDQSFRSLQNIAYGRKIACDVILGFIESLKITIKNEDLNERAD